MSSDLCIIVGNTPGWIEKRTDRDGQTDPPGNQDHHPHYLLRSRKEFDAETKQMYLHLTEILCKLLVQ